MPLVTYVGSHDAVDVPDAGLYGVQRGESVDVPDAIAEALLEQPANWVADGDPIPFDVTPTTTDDLEV